MRCTFFAFQKKFFDIVTCFHVIEHLEKKEGLKLIKQIEKIARKQIIVATPVGFQELHVYDNNPYQTHKSGWLPNDFKNKRFTVRGCTGLRCLRGERASSLFNNIVLKVINFLVTYITQLVTYYKPSLAWGMICTKNIKN